MRRFTILGLMGLVLGVAVAIAALRNADDYWAGGLMLATALLIGVVTLGAVYHSGRRRAGRLGFAVFGGGYFALAFLGLSDQNLAKLPTTWLLAYVHQRVAPPQSFIFTVHGRHGPGQTGQGTILTSNVTPGPLANTVTATTTSQFALASGVSGDTSTRWKSLLPGAANYEAFSVVGHCLFALLAGLLGMIIARRYQARRSEPWRPTRMQWRESRGSSLARIGPASLYGGPFDRTAEWQASARKKQRRKLE